MHHSRLGRARRALAVVVLVAVASACADRPAVGFGPDDGAVGDAADAATTFDLPTFPDRNDPAPDGADRDAAGPSDGAADATARVCADREVCGNGFDDDCDGRADDGCVCIPGSTQSCYLAAPATAGVGLCATGTQRCEGGQEFGQWSACAGAVGPAGEACDGMDNDCDGVVDDGCECRAGETRRCYGGPAGTRGVGVCADGMQLCFAGPGGVGSVWGACTGDTRPGRETCDTMDNDCNGTVDDCCGCMVGASRSCYAGPTGTAGVGRCRAGMQTCQNACGGGSSSGWSDCAGQVLPQAERCDGVDDDCNGVVDDGCLCRLGETQPCYDGAMGTRGIGACADGTRSCVAGPGGVGTVWGACTGQRLPVGETCDDVDNNCNGGVDETCVCRRGQSQVCYTGPTGTRGVGQCRPGMQACEVTAGVARWATCTGQTLPAAEVCGDGVDNDCDGMAEEGCVCAAGQTRSCYTGPTGTAGRGLCRPGTQRCATTPAGLDWGVCEAQVLPQAERCDGMDNDCDGVVDNGCACAPGATRSCYTGAAGTANVGVCRAGSQSCVVGAGGVGSSWGACAGQVLPGTESCNSNDDNCDGRIDEGCACTVGASRSCYGGPGGTSGVGVCRAGSQRCVLVAGVPAWEDCTGDVTPGAEVCSDTLDNDCDGRTNEDCLCTLGATQACYTGPMGTAGVGVCRAGSQSCVAGAGGVGTAWGACGAQVLPGPELCDRVDNDCDGMVDEGCACTPGATQSCYTGPMGTAGVGLCRAGSQTCAAGAGGVGSAWGACTGQVLPAAEVCNAMDDNCNGMADDGVSCGGPTVMCPADRTVPAGTVVVLTATTTAAAPATYRWEVVTAPPGASFVLGSPTSLSTTFGSVIVGTFTLRFTVTDASGRTASCMTTVTNQGRGLRVELTWDSGVRPPTTTGRVDLDLHLHNRLATGWFDDPNDCFFRNRTPRWDARNSTLDDPSLDVDNVYGFGPENIRVDEPVPGSQTYSVGVHYFEGALTAPATATVRVYCGTVLRGTYTRRITGSTAAAANNDLWRVARVTFSDPSNCNVVVVDDVVSTSRALTSP